MRIIRVQAVQAHAVPKHAHAPRGPFPPEMQGFNQRSIELDGYGEVIDGSEYLEENDANPAAQPQIITEYESEQAADGANFPLGATAQNNFRPEKMYRCRHCDARVAEHELEEHECDDE